MDYIKYTPEISNNWSRAFSYAIKEKPWTVERIKNSMTASQLESKLYLATELQKIQTGFKNVVVIGGWYCHYLATLLIDELDTEVIYNYDIDEDSREIGYKFNMRYKKSYKFVTRGQNLYMNNLDKKQASTPIDLVINPSCEHMFPMKALRDKHFNNGELFVLQSTDCEDFDDHINTVSGPDELADQAGLVDIYYSGVKVLDNGMNRFMVIGR